MGVVLGHFSDIHMKYSSVQTALLRTRLLSFLKQEKSG